MFWLYFWHPNYNVSKIGILSSKSTRNTPWNKYKYSQLGFQVRFSVSYGQICHSHAYWGFSELHFCHFWGEMRLFVDSLNWKIPFFLKGIGVLFSKACLCYFYNLSKESISKMMKEAFYFIKKLFLLWRYSSFCDFFCFLSIFSRFKGSDKIEMIVVNLLA